MRYHQDMTTKTPTREDQARLVKVHDMVKVCREHGIDATIAALLADPGWTAIAQLTGRRGDVSDTTKLMILRHLAAETPFAFTRVHDATLAVRQAAAPKPAAAAKPAPQPADPFDGIAF